MFIVIYGDARQGTFEVLIAKTSKFEFYKDEIERQMNIKLYMFSSFYKLSNFLS